MLIPENTAEKRLIHKGTVVCRLLIVFAGMVKVIVETAPKWAQVKVGDELQFSESTWDKYKKVER